MKDFLFFSHNQKKIIEVNQIFKCRKINIQNLNNFKEVDHIHFFGYYIGNYPSLNKDKIKKICKILNGISL